MEVEASKVLFGRSVVRHNLRYQICLCDGDAKTIHTLNSMKIYTEEIKKRGLYQSHSKAYEKWDNELAQVTNGY